MVFSDIYDGDTKVCTVYWSCLYDRIANEFQILNGNEDYIVGLGAWTRYEHALGLVHVEVSKK